MSRNLYEKVEYLQNMLISQATGGHSSNEDYKKIRNELINEPLLKNRLPNFLNTNRELQQFWQFIKYKYGTYGERRGFIWDSFAPVLNYLEKANGSPSDDSISQTIVGFNAEYVNIEWQKALQRRFDDPEAAITSSRSLVESVCKHILDEQTILYDEKADLPKLYKLTADCLNLSPGQHHEILFKQILGGCQSVIEGLGSIRNKLSDAHGKGTLQAKPKARHAELAVNLAGAMANFLIQTFEESKNKRS